MFLIMCIIGKMGVFVNLLADLDSFEAPVGYIGEDVQKASESGN